MLYVLLKNRKIINIMVVSKTQSGKTGSMSARDVYPWQTFQKNIKNLFLNIIIFNYNILLNIIIL